MCDRPRGARQAYVATQEVIDIHGANGLGEVAVPAAERAPEEQDAVSFIIDAVNTYGKDLMLVPTGPLTTIAAVLERDPSVAEKIGKIVLMGGALTVCGNVSPCAEANIANDPELKVLANVDSTLLQYPGAFKRCQPDHCVQVLRVDDTAEGKMVILNDPGHADGKGVVYPLEVFERAYRGDITTIRKAEMA